MRQAYELLGQFFLRFLSRLSGLRRVPVLGRMTHWLSYKILPPEILVWTQVQRGGGQGLWIKVYPRTGSCYYRGSIEPEVQCLLREHLSPGMVFYDIGANIGFFTMVAARLVGDKGKVFAFEPEEEALRRLRENVERNGLTNVSVVETAVWSTAGSVLFSRCDFRFSTDRGLGKIVSSAAEANTILVPSISLDYFAINASAPHLIKCDAEGAEVEVFRGAVNLLAQYKPIVICEMHSSDKISVLRELFEGFGYQVRLLNDNRLVARP